MTIVALTLGVFGCTSADVYPVTGDPDATAGQSGGTAGSAGSAGSGGTANGNAGGSAATPDCALSAPAGDTRQTLIVDGMPRSYWLHVPPTYDGSTRVPLVVDFHGMGETGMSERSLSPYPAVLDAEGVVMAFPDGLRGPAGTAWNVGPCCVEDVDDVAFARALVAHVQSTACIDPRRVYAVGTLTGGGIAHYLACHAADVFAAVAPAAFDLLAENVDDCDPPRPVTVIAFRGTADARVPYEGGPSSLVPGMPLTFLGARESFDTWATINGCVGPAAPADQNGCAAYSGCADGAEVILCTAQGGREAPGDPDIAWPVLERHRL